MDIKVLQTYYQHMKHWPSPRELYMPMSFQHVRSLRSQLPKHPAPQKKNEIW